MVLFWFLWIVPVVLAEECFPFLMLCLYHIGALLFQIQINNEIVVHRTISLGKALFGPVDYVRHNISHWSSFFRTNMRPGSEPSSPPLVPLHCLTFHRPHHIPTHNRQPSDYQVAQDRYFMMTDNGGTSKADSHEHRQSWASIWPSFQMPRFSYLAFVAAKRCTTGQIGTVHTIGSVLHMTKKENKLLHVVKV